MGVKYYTLFVSPSPGPTPSETTLPDVALKLEKQGQDDQVEDREVTRFEPESVGSDGERRETQSSLVGL